MTKDDDPVDYINVEPHKMGWMRRSDLGARVWELPDGRLYKFHEGTKELVPVIKKRGM